MDIHEAIQHCRSRADSTPCGVDHAQLATWLGELVELRERMDRLEEVHLHGCECSQDEACEFVRERDAALARVAELEDEVDRLEDEVERLWWCLEMIYTSLGHGSDDMDEAIGNRLLDDLCEVLREG